MFTKDDSSRSIQRLAPLCLSECDACHNRVYFRFLSSRIVSKDMKVVYLRCPICGASATQLQEVEILPAKMRKPSRVKYVYCP